MISFDHAYQLTLEHIHPLPPETVGLLAAAGRIAAQDFLAKVDVPSLDVSLKDGYAILSTDICNASPTSPVNLTLAGNLAAGDAWEGLVHPSQAVRILSGAPLPQGADAVVAEEFTQLLPDGLRVLNHAEPGRNVLRRGADIQAGQRVVSARQKFHPTVIGLLAAAGYQEVQVIRRPRVAIIATGDEVLAPGQPIIPGKLYASNLFTLAAWCQRFGFEAETFVLPDHADTIRRVLLKCLEQSDVVLTSGGAWQGERDLVVQIMDALGWRKIYHRVRMGPGKAIGFGLYQGKPVFCLPGGPPSNHMAFLQLALPGMQRLAGEQKPGLPHLHAIMAETVSGQVDWTQFIHGQLVEESQHLLFQPLRYPSRLQEMAHTDAIVRIPEGTGEISANSTVMVQVLANQ
ncbi:MAG: molybdopterin molybdotransferase MoeA [Anaerolineales bacterium]|nr:molybdopterin molybdotransferase MoeA [Anaerolineales bacterium]